MSVVSGFFLQSAKFTFDLLIVCCDSSTAFSRLTYIDFQSLHD